MIDNEPKDSDTRGSVSRALGAVREQFIGAEMLARHASNRLPNNTGNYALMAACLSVLIAIASDPVAAQEFCDEPAGQLLSNVEIMLVSYGSQLLFLAFLIGCAMWAMTPLFMGQSAIGLGMILLACGAAIAFVVGTQFFGMTFEVAGSGAESCSSYIG